MLTKFQEHVLRFVLRLYGQMIWTLLVLLIVTLSIQSTKSNIET